MEVAETLDDKIDRLAGGIAARLERLPAALAPAAPAPDEAAARRPVAWRLRPPGAS